MLARRASGFSMAVVLVVLALVMVGIVAGLALTRLGRANTDAATTVTRLATAQAALEQYAGAARRLPCPADPTANTGAEATTGTQKCTFEQGTVPWKTIGLRRDDAFDAWGFKISYRVYTGPSVASGVGSLVQADGINMSECDTVDPVIPPVDVNANGLCVSNADVYQRATSDTKFLAGKGLTVTDLGTVHNDAAYVLVSHGATALGAYTASGVQRPLPTGVERNNTLATGPFTIQAFSDSEIAATLPAHFDDVLAYRTLPELIRRVGLYARDWPEGGKASTVFASLGLSGSGNLGMSSFTAAGVTYSSLNSGTASNFSYATVDGIQGLGGAAGGSLALGMTETFRVDLGSAQYSSFALTMNNFGWLSGSSPHDREQVEVRFYSGGSLVGVAMKRQACRVDGGYATIVVAPSVAGALYDRVEVQPLSFSLRPADSSLVYISELAACGPTAPNCSTSVADAGNTCATPTIAASAFAPASVAAGTPSTWTLTLANGTDSAANMGMAFTYQLPTGLAFTSIPGGCAGSVSLTAGAKGFTASGLAIADDAPTCTLTATVSAAAAGTYADGTASVSATANVANALAGGTLTVTP